MGKRAALAAEEPMEVEVNAERCLHMELHSSVLRVSAWSEFDSAELRLKQKQGLNENREGFFAGMKRRLQLLSCIRE